MSSFPSSLSSVDLDSSRAITQDKLDNPSTSTKQVNKQANKKKGIQDKDMDSVEELWTKLDENKGFHLYSGNPGTHCGHVVDNASSYFDR